MSNKNNKTKSFQTLARKNISSGGSFETSYGYSRAVMVDNQVYVSGTCAPANCEHKGVYDQTKAILKIISKALREAGTSVKSVVRTIVYVRDMNDASEVARAHADVFGEIRPASTLVQVVSMMRPWQKVEIAAYAIKGSKRQKISSGGAFEQTFGYSRAVAVGDEIHVSGSCAPANCEDKGVYDQAIAIFKIIEKALKEANASFDDVIRTVVYLRDINEASEVARAHAKVFGKIRPASTLIQIISAMRPWQKVEIETYAQRGANRKKISSGRGFEPTYGYSRAIAVNNQIHVSGTCAPATHEKKNTYQQSKAILKTIKKALKEANATFEDVTRTVVYLRDINDAEEVARAHAEVFGEIRPASTLVQIISAMRPWQKVEIEAYAVKPNT